MTTVIKNDTADFKKTVQPILESGKAIVSFTKQDGTDRVMTCTADLTQIPAGDVPSMTSGRTQNPTVFPVYDLELGKWRSFRWDAVKQVELVDEA